MKLHAGGLSRKLLAAIASTAITVPAAALAQEQGLQTIIEEIVVTARKREETLQSVPESVSAIGAVELQAAYAKLAGKG